MAGRSSPRRCGPPSRRSRTSTTPIRSTPTSSGPVPRRSPVRFEVDRLRDGRSFCTRAVVARQSGGAHPPPVGVVPEARGRRRGPDRPQPIAPHPDDCRRRADDGRGSWSGDRWSATPAPASRWAGSVWSIRSKRPTDPRLRSRLHLRHDAVLVGPQHPSPPGAGGAVQREVHGSQPSTMRCGSTRPARADDWHLFSWDCHGLRGPGHDGRPPVRPGRHPRASISQEVLLRERRPT